MKIEDLDVLRPEPKFIKIGGKEIDVSFIPCAITFDIDQIMEQLQNITSKDLMIDEEAEKDFTDEEKLEAKNLRNKKIKETFDLSIRLCSTFCQHKYPELDETYFMDECDAGQVRKFVEYIREALNRAYNGIEVGSKNLKAPKKKNQ
jgi:hypothetical protein